MKTDALGRATRPDVPPPRPRARSPRRKGEGGGGTDALVPLPCHERQGRAESPIVLFRDLQAAGVPGAAVRARGSPAGKDPASPRKSSAAGLRPLPAPRARNAATFPSNSPGSCPGHGGQEGPGGSRGARCGGRPGAPGRTRAEPAREGVARPGAHAADALTWRTHLLRARAARRETVERRPGCPRARFLFGREGGSRPRPPVASAHCTTPG